jgi:hypothetical protein
LDTSNLKEKYACPRVGDRKFTQRAKWHLIAYEESQYEESQYQDQYEVEGDESGF